MFIQTSDRTTGPAATGLRHCAGELRGLRREVADQLLAGVGHAVHPVHCVQWSVPGVTGLFTWARIDDQRQRSFATGYPGRPARRTERRIFVHAPTCQLAGPVAQNSPDMDAAHNVRSVLVPDLEPWVPAMGLVTQSRRIGDTGVPARRSPAGSPAGAILAPEAGRRASSRSVVLAADPCSPARPRCSRTSGRST